MSSLSDRAKKRHDAQMSKQAEEATHPVPSTSAPSTPAAEDITPKLQRGGATAAATATMAALPIRETIPVKLTDLHVRPGYERHPSEFSGVAWDEFVASIAVSKGNVQPIDVRQVRGGATLYQIIAGERRFRALTQLEIPFAICAVRDLDEERADFIHDTENAKRADKSPFSLAMQLSVMLKSGRYADQKDLADKLGRDKSNVSRLLSLYDKAPSDLWVRIKDPTGLTFRDADVITKAYDKPAFSEWVKRLDRAAVTPVDTLVKKAKEVCARPKVERTVVDKIREVERGDAFHIVLPRAVPKHIRAKVLAYAKELAAAE